MKWHHSIITKVSLIFLIALVGFSAILFVLRSHIVDIEKQNVYNFTKYILIASNNKPKDSLKKFGYNLVKDEKLKNFLLNRQNTYSQPNIFNYELPLKSLDYKNKLYIILNNQTIYKTPYERKIFPKVLLPIATFLLILSLYIAVIKSIIPLYDLRKKIKEFANGNYDIECKSNKKDEIAILANDFDKSIKKFKKLKDSRQLFLRNIMHELKTPITKGKLACEMIENSTYKEVIQNSFKRQENLIEEFSRIEKLNANVLQLNKKNYSLQDILDFSLDITNHNKRQIILKIEHTTIEVDFELFGVALKNLIDNGINYSKDKKVEIIANEDKIIIKNRANPLEFSLNKYEQPFFLEGNKQRSSRGLGFGLFITLNLLKLHKMKLEYKHKNGTNIFSINF